MVISKINIMHNYLIIALLFTITINTFISYSILFLIFLWWIFTKNFKQKLQIIKTDQLSLTFLIFFCIHLLGILWTQSYDEGFRILSKQKIYLLAVLIISFFDKRFAKYAIYAFLTAMFISEIYSIYLYFTNHNNLSGSLPSPFMHHMHYSLILAFTFGYLINEINFKKLFIEKINLFYLFFAILTLITLFINKGRIGQLALLIVLFILAIGKFKLSFIKSIISVMTITLILFFSAYNISDQFKTRFDKAAYEFNEVIGTGKRDSISCRFEMWNYALELGSKNPIIGIGTGDSVSEMKNLLSENGFQQLFFDCGLGLKYQFNPHNNFLLYFMQFGIIGLFALIFALFYQFKIAYKLHSIEMILLLSVTVIGMLTTSLISMHIKYMFFYAFMLTMLYLKALNSKHL